MDVTCGISLNVDSTTMAQLELALLSSQYDEVEKYTKKLRKKREVSGGFENIMDCYLLLHKSSRLHASCLELDLNHLLAYQIPVDIGRKLMDTLKKVLMDTEGTDLELKLAYILLGIVSLFRFEKNSLTESLGFFDKVDFDLTKKFLLYDISDTEIVQSSVIEKIFGTLGLYFRGVALELHGNREDALDQYEIITDFLFRFRQLQFTRARSVFDFHLATLYRGAVLCGQLNRSAEAAGLFRAFLNFHQVDPKVQIQHSQPVNSTIRLLRALCQYADLLERTFSRQNFKNFTDSDLIVPQTRSESLSMWQSTNAKEELILISLLMESLISFIHQNAPQVKPEIFSALQDLKIDEIVMGRFARIGYLDGIVRLQKARFQHSVIDVQLFYRKLLHSFLAAGKLELAILSAHNYLESRLKKTHDGSSTESDATATCDVSDQMTLLSIAKLFLAIPSKMEAAWEILNAESFNSCFTQVPHHLLRAQYFLLQNRLGGLLSDNASYLNQAREEAKRALKIDESNSEALLLLSAIEAEGENLVEAEKAIKRSLSYDSSQARAWWLLALLKTARRDFEGCLLVCNNELGNMIEKDLNMSLLKISTLLQLNRSEEAIESLKRIISANLRAITNNPLANIRMDGGMTVVSDGALGPGSFLSKFLGDQESIYDYENIMMGLEKDDDSESISANASTGQSRASNLKPAAITDAAPSAKLSSFMEYSQTAFPLGIEEYLGAKMNGFALNNLPSRHLLTANDLKVLGELKVLNSTNVISTVSSSSSASSTTSLLLAALWLEVARVYLTEGLFEDAQAAAAQALRSNEVFAPIYATLGLISERRQKSCSSDALQFYRKGLSIDSEDGNCILGLARCLLRNNESVRGIFLEVEGPLRDLLNRDPMNSEAWAMLAKLLAASGRQLAAQEHFERAMMVEERAFIRSIRSIPLFFINQ